MQVCTSLQTDNHASTPPLKFFASQMHFLPLNQQHQSTEGKKSTPLQSLLISTTLVTTTATTAIHSMTI